MKLDKERQAKANCIKSDLRNILSENNIVDKESFFANIASMISHLDTDIAINVMEDFGKIGKEYAMTIKVTYGY